MSDKKKRTGFFSRFKKEVVPTALSSGALAAGTSAHSATVSGSDNSAATSRNLQNASKQLDQYFKEIDDDDERTSVLSMSRNIEKSESYVNSSFAGHAVQEALLDPPSILLGDLGATCAKKVYRKPGSDTFEPTGFIQVGEARKIEADKFGGLKKAATICLYKGKPAVTGDGGVLSVIVVAIRGTASIHDWMVNFNDAALQKSTINSKLAALKVNDGTEDLIQSDFLGTTQEKTAYKAHEGFLNCAKFMTPKIAQELTYILEDISPAENPILLLTGHSAGGAVAAMLYAHLHSAAQTDLSSLRDKFGFVHCITFGAPPITAPPLAAANDSSILLSFINESDPIPRCDREYLNSLLRLYVSPMPKSGARWELPEPLLYNAGEVVIIGKQTEEDGATIFFKPNETGEGSLKEIVMGNPKAHKMDLYLKKVKIGGIIMDGSQSQLLSLG